jgi:hypothetical protein
MRSERTSRRFDRVAAREQVSRRGRAAGVRRHFGNFLLVHAVLQRHLSVAVQGCLLAKSWTNFAVRNDPLKYRIDLTGVPKGGAICKKNQCSSERVGHSFFPLFSAVFRKSVQPGMLRRGQQRSALNKDQSGGIPGRGDCRFVAPARTGRARHFDRAVDGNGARRDRRRCRSPIEPVLRSGLLRGGPGRCRSPRRRGASWRRR